METTLLISLISGTFLMLLGAILAYTVRINARQAKQGEDIAILKTQVSPLWAKVQAQIAADLHQPHPRYAEMDKLLEKLEALTISDEERGRLKELLLERSKDAHPDISEEQREKAKLMIVVMDMVLIEANIDPEDKLTIALVEAKKTAMQSNVVVEAVKQAQGESNAKTKRKS